MKNIVVTIFLFSTINTMGQFPAPVNFTADQDHKNMMEQLGVRKLRPGPSGNDTARNHANYDESVANPYPVLPDVLTTKKGKKVTDRKSVV